MKRCICNTEPTVTCAGMKYYVSCPKCGLATDMYDALEDAEKAWDSRRVEMGKYVLKVVEEKKAIEKKKEVVPKEELAAETLKLANKLKAGPLADYTNIKKQINGSYFDNYRTYIKDVEAPTQNSSGDTEDFKEGVKATEERRAANFRGR